MKASFAFAAAILLSGALPAPAALPSYRVLDRYAVGGSGSWDYLRLEPAGRRLFVSHQNRVEVIDADTGRRLGAITGLHGVHGMAFAPELNRGFITNGQSGTVTVFDLATMQATGSLTTGGQKPDAVEYDPATRLLVVSNGHSNNLSIIDAASGAVRHLVPLAGNPESLAFDGRGHVEVDVESHSSISQVDLATGRVEADWPLAPGEGPTGLAIDRASRRLFASCGGNEKLIVLDADSGRQVAVLPIGDDSDGAAFDPATRRVFSSNRDGTLTVIQEDAPDHYTVLANVPTQSGARTLAVDSAKDRIYLPVAKFGPAPAPTPAKPEPKAPVLPDTFEVLVVGQE